MTAKELRALALELSRDERELLAIELLRSLVSSDVQEDVDPAWAAEIRGRSQRLHSGETELFDASDTFDRVQRRLAARSGT